jgi:exosortase D (VPLPA-CTERM-specific)
LATYDITAAERGTEPASLLRWSAWLVVLGIASYFLFAESFVAVFGRYTEPEFSHGYLIPLLSLWIVWQRRRLIIERRSDGALSGWFLVAAGVGFAWLCKVVGVESGPYLGAIPTAFGLAVVTMGWASARLLAVPLGMLVFGFPLPDAIFIDISTSLQLVSSKLGTGMLDAMGIPVYRAGNIIDLGPYKLQVAEACSGLRYLLPLLTFGVLCAYMYRAPWWAKLFIVALTLPLTIVLNSARIAMTGMFMHWGSVELADGFMHLFEGWVVFLIALAILFATMWALLLLRGWRGGMADILDFDRINGTPAGEPPAPTGPRPAAVAPATVPRAAIVAVATVAAVALLLIPVELRPQTAPERPGLVTYPLQVGDWSGTPDIIDRTTRRVLASDDYLLADYIGSGPAERVNLWVAYYGSQLADARVHLPTECLPGAGWEYVSFDTRRLELANFRGEPLTINRGVITQGNERMLMYFWMEMRGRSLVSGSMAKLLNVWDALVIGRSDGALVRVATRLAPGEDVAAGDARLRRFLNAAYVHLEPHVGL